MNFATLALLLAFAQDVKPVEFRVLTVEGFAEYKELGKNARWKPVTVNSSLPSGTMLQTGLKSKVVLNFGQDTVLVVKSSTLITLTEGWARQKKVGGKVHIELGSVRVGVNPERKEELDFEISTPEATASIRGTDLTVTHHSDLATTVYQHEGRIDFQTVQRLRTVLDHALAQVNSRTLEDLPALLEARQHLLLALGSDLSLPLGLNRMTQEDLRDAAERRMGHRRTEILGVADGPPFEPYAFKVLGRIDSILRYDVSSDLYQVLQSPNSIFRAQPSGTDWFFFLGPLKVWHLQKVTYQTWSMVNLRNSHSFSFNYSGVGTRWIPQ